jgi:hypothetical protein
VSDEEIVAGNKQKKEGNHLPFFNYIIATILTFTDYGL